MSGVGAVNAHVNGSYQNIRQPGEFIRQSTCRVLEDNTSVRHLIHTSKDGNFKSPGEPSLSKGTPLGDIELLVQSGFLDPLR